MHLAHLFTALGTTFTIAFPHVFVHTTEVKIDTSSAFHSKESNIIVKTKGESVSVSITNNGETVHISYPENPSLSPTVSVPPTTSPTVFPTVTLTPTITASPSSTPVLTSAVTPTHSPTPQPTTQDAVSAFIMDEINAYRQSHGLSNIETEPFTCAFAQTRAQEITSDFTHDGFERRIDDETLPFPSYSYINENIAMNPNYKNVADAWIASAGHAENVRADTPYGCVGHAGNYYTYIGWRP